MHTEFELLKRIIEASDKVPQSELSYDDYCNLSPEHKELAEAYTAAREYIAQSNGIPIPDKIDVSKEFVNLTAKYEEGKDA